MVFWDGIFAMASLNDCVTRLHILKSRAILESELGGAADGRISAVRLNRDPCFPFASFVSFVDRTRRVSQWMKSNCHRIWIV